MDTQIKLERILTQVSILCWRKDYKENRKDMLKLLQSALDVLKEDLEKDNK